MVKTLQVNLRLPPPVKRQAERLAHKRHLTLTEYFKMLIRDDLERTKTHEKPT